MKKLLVIILIGIFSNAHAQSGTSDVSRLELKKLYKKAVKKITTEKMGKIFIYTKDTLMDDAQIEYERKHCCVCKDKQCHGPRLTLESEARDKSIYMTVFPNGDFISETEHSSDVALVIDGMTLTKVDPEKEKRDENFARQAAKKILEAFCK